MIKKIVYVQPFTIEGDGFDGINNKRALFWPIILDSFLKEKIPSLKTDLLYLPVEFEKLGISIKSYSEKGRIYKAMDDIIAQLENDIDSNTAICLSIMTAYHVLASRIIARYFKKRYPSTIIITGGTQCTASPSDFEYPEAPWDYIIKGEGEVSLYKIIRSALETQQTPKVIMGEYLVDMNELPELDYFLMEEYITSFNRIGINLSRGCPFNCDFCIEKEFRNFNPSLKGWRAFSPKRAAKEAGKLIDYGLENNINHFMFSDPIFGFKKSWLTKFLNLFNYEEELESESTIWAETRVNILNEDLIKKFQKRRFALMYGLESYSEKMLLLMNKTRDPVSYLNGFERVIKLHTDLEYPCNVFALFGYPGETKQTIKTSFSRIKSILMNDPSNAINISARNYHHYPGSNVYKNIDLYDKNHGTIVYFPEWWKDENLFEFGACCVQPSRELPVKECFLAYYEGFRELIKLNLNKEVPLAHKMVLLMQLKTLKEKRELYFKFLENQNISKENPSVII